MYKQINVGYKMYSKAMRPTVGRMLIAKYSMDPVTALYNYLITIKTILQYIYKYSPLKLIVIHLIIKSWEIYYVLVTHLFV